MPPRPGQEEPLAHMTKLVNYFLTRPDTEPFLEPVDWRGLELWDYPDVIAEPMDLGTIKRKLDRNQYETAAAVAYDMRLVWRNCMTYNTTDSDFYRLAKTCSRRFEDRYRKITKEFDVGEDLEDTEEEAELNDNNHNDEDHEEEEETLEDGIAYSAATSLGSNNNTPESRRSARSPGPAAPPSMDANARLAANILLLNGPELAYIMNELETHCPEALECNAEGGMTEHVEIVMDKLDQATFQRISQYATEQAAIRRKGLMVSEEPLAAINDISNKRKRKR